MANFQQWGVMWVGEGGVDAGLAPPYRICRGEREGWGGGWPCSCLLSTCMQSSFSFLFFPPSFCCGGLFRYKKACGKPYTPRIGGGRISSFVLCLVALWGPGPLNDLSLQREAGPQPPVVPPHPLPCPRCSAALSGVHCRPPSASPTS
jgi:hypothetical protein